MTSDTTSHLDLTLMVAEGQGDLPRTRRAPRIDKTGSGRIHMGRWRTLVAVALAVGLAVVLAGCQQGEKAAGNVRAGPAGPGAVQVLMQDNKFQPQVLKVRAGSPVTVEVRNDGDKSHNFTIEGLHVGTGAMHHGDVKTVTGRAGCAGRRAVRAVRRGAAGAAGRPEGDRGRAWCRPGELALLDGGRRTATLRAVTPCRVAVVPGDRVARDRLDQLARQHDQPTT